MKTYNKCIEFILILLCLTECILIGIIRTVYMLDGFTVALFPIGMFMVLLFNDSFHIHVTRKILFPCIVLSILFFLMLSIEEVLRRFVVMDNAWNHFIFKVLFFPLLIISVYTDIQFILEKLSVRQTLKDSEDNTKRSMIDIPKSDMRSVKDNVECKRLFGLYRQTWLIVACTLFFSFAYFPGELHSDFEIGLLNWHNIPWSDFHTLSFQFFIKLCTLLIPKVFMVTLVQGFLFVLVNNYAIDTIYKYISNPIRNAWIYSMLIVTFGSIIIRYIPNLCKDTNFVITMYGFSICLLRFIIDRQRDTMTYVKLGIMGLFASMFRHAALPIVIITILVLMIYEMSEFKGGGGETSLHQFFILRIRKLLIVIMIPIIGILLVRFIGFGVLNAEKNPQHISYSVPMNLVGAMAYRSDVKGYTIDEQELSMMEEIMPFEKWIECYNRYYCDPISRTTSTIGDDILKLENKEIQRNVIMLDWYYLTHHPYDFVISFFDVNSLVWEIASPPDMVEFIPMAFPDYLEVHSMHKGEFYYMSERWCEFIDGICLLRTIFYRGGLILFLLFTLCTALIVNKRKKYIIPILPVFIYAALLMISIPAPEVRYIMIFMIYAIFFYIFMLNIETEKQLQIAPSSGDF